MSEEGARCADDPQPARGSRLAYAAYDGAVGVAALLGLPVAAWLLLRGRGAELRERLGRLPAEVAHLAGRGAVWIHAASVGEVRAAEPLIELLRRTQPGRSVLMTTTTVTGRDAARNQLQVPAALLPVDCGAIVDRLVRRLRPAVLVVMETEIWPNLFRAADREGIPVILASARLSAASGARYGWIRPVVRAALSHVSRVAAQTQADAERFLALGASPERIEVVGSLKFARQAPASDAGPPITFGDRPVLVGASTQPGEEKLVLEACSKVWESHPEALLILGPRRPERFDDVADLLEEQGIPFVRRSRCDSAPDPGLRVLLLDSLGELSGFLGIARAAFVGGTIAPLGGHNVLEPGVYGVPTAFGPRLENVREAADALLEVDGARQIEDAAGLAAFWSDMLGDAAMAKAMGERARAELARRAAAGTRTLALVEAHLGTAP